MEDIQRLVPDSDLEELLQTLDAMNTSTQDLAARPDNYTTPGQPEGPGVHLQLKVPGERLTPFPRGISHKVHVNLRRWMPTRALS